MQASVGKLTLKDVASRWKSLGTQVRTLFVLGCFFERIETQRDVPLRKLWMKYT